MRRSRFLLEGAALAALTASACTYTYSNPAERLEAGEISGRTVADPGATGTPHPTGGIAVSLKGSSFDQVTHDTGRFTMLPLPPGQHTLLFRRGTQLALSRRVQVALGPNGQPDGVTLGDVDVPFAGVIEGAVAGPNLGGVVLDEVTGLTGTADFQAYQLQGASVGDHRLKIGLLSASEDQEWVGGPLDLTLPDQAQSSVTRAAVVAVHLAAGTGELRLRVLSLDPVIAPPDVTVTVEDALHGPVAGVPAPDASGRVVLTVPEGVYHVTIAAPPAHAAEVSAPDPATAIVLQGEVADVGSLYLVPPGLPAAAQLRCDTAADCSGTACAAGRCTQWSPPAVAPAGIPFCFSRGDFCSPTFSCQSPGDLQGQCFTAGAVQACVPCGARCTVDGLTAFQAAPTNPASGQCP